MHTAFHRFTNNTQKRYRSLVFFFVNWGNVGVFSWRGEVVLFKRAVENNGIFMGVKECEPFSTNEDQLSLDRMLLLFQGD